MLSRATRPALRAGSTAALRPTPAAPPIFLQTANYATLKEIEARLNSIKNITKITKTMKIVASTKLTKAQRAMNAADIYGKTSQQVFDEAETKPPEDQSEKTLLVIASSDKGLCGGVHSGLTRAARRLFEEKPGDYDVCILGEKVKAQLSRSNPKMIVLTFSNVGRQVPTFADAQAIADQITMLPTDYKDIKILYNKWKNQTSYYPVTIDAFNEETIRNSPNFVQFEIDDEVVSNLKEYALANDLYWALAEGHAVEQCARRNAMDNASKNADEMIDKLSMIYNRTRQAVITGELVEIITGAAASEDQ